MKVYVIFDNEGNIYSVHRIHEKARQAIFKYYPKWETTQRLQYNTTYILPFELDKLYFWETKND